MICPHTTPEIKAILTNRRVIAIDQDHLGQQATCAYSEGEVDVWVLHLSGGALALDIVQRDILPVLIYAPR